MIYLLLSILSSAVIFTTFKISERFNTNLVKLITVNYLVATILGFSFNRQPLSFPGLLSAHWFPFAILIGFSFILMFFLIGYSTRKSGVAVTSIASKMSMVIPVLFSILYFSEKFNAIKISGLVIAAIAVFLSSYRPVLKKKGFLLFFLPIAIFFGSGITDSIVKYAQTYHIPNNISLLFSAVVFLVALILGIFYTLLKRKSISANYSFAEITGGIILGAANFGSLYFFILALNNSKLDSSIVFGLNNICIVLLSVVVGSAIFKEELTKTNQVGIVLAILAILILMIY